MAVMICDVWLGTENDFSIRGFFYEVLKKNNYVIELRRINYVHFRSQNWFITYRKNPGIFKKKG